MTFKDLRVLFKMAVHQPCNATKGNVSSLIMNTIPSKKILQNIRLESKPKEVLDKQGGSSHPFWLRCCTEQRALDNLATSAAAQGNVKPNGQLKTASITVNLRKSLPADTVLLISSALQLDFLVRLHQQSRGGEQDRVFPKISGSHIKAAQRV